jgi:HSP90 family molecular chaperone
MVSDVVTVITRAFGSDEAFKWESQGAEGYTIEPWEKDEVGTDITLKLSKTRKTKTMINTWRSIPYGQLLKNTPILSATPLRWI